MKIFSGIVCSSLLITTPSLMALPIPTITVHDQDIRYEPIHIPDPSTMSYDEMVDFLALIESDSFEERCSPDELDQINQLLAFLAMEGATEDEKPEMEQAVASLFIHNQLHDNLQYAYAADFGYTCIPAIMHQTQDAILCKSWVKKSWNATKKFVTKHKKAIIIGAIIVVVVAVAIVVAVYVGAPAIGGAIASGTAAGVAAASESGSSPPSSTTLHEQISTFKETIAPEQFAAAPESSGISIEENGRIVGSHFAHKMVDNVTQNPYLAKDLKDFGVSQQYSMPSWQKTYPGPFEPSNAPNLAFSTDYTPHKEFDINLAIYETRGDLALASECYEQAKKDLYHASTIEPNNPIPYLKTGIANFELGNYDQGIKDYEQYVERKKEPFSVKDFSIGFAKGVPKGVAESGEGTIRFLTDCVKHPVQTSIQVVESINHLNTLVKNDEFGVVAQVLSPELHQLVTEWDTLPSEKRGELAGYAVGKLGTDFLAPGAIAKVGMKSVRSARELTAICKNLELAQGTLILETASGPGNAAKVAQAVTVSKLGEELGFTPREITELHQAGKLESTVTQTYEHLTSDMQACHAHIKSAEKFLKQHKGYMPESRVRELIHQTGMPTFPRPKGIPKDYKVKLSRKGVGMKYVHPTNEQISIRVMPGKPHSPHPHQQKPYVKQSEGEKFFDKFGKTVDEASPEAHIPYEDFVYKKLEHGKMFRAQMMTTGGIYYKAI